MEKPRPSNENVQEASPLQITHKNPLMLAVEVIRGESIEVLLQREYVEKHRTVEEVAYGVAVSEQTIRKWLTKAGIEKRGSDDPIYALRRKKAVQASYAANKEEIVAKIHSGDSDDRRSGTLTERWQNNPLSMTHALGALQQGLKTRAENTKKRQQEAFGEDMAATLYEMHVVQGLTDVEIGQKTGYSAGRIRKFLRQAGIPVRNVRKKPTTKD